MELKIKVGASTDSSFNQVFRGVADAAAQANRKISSDEKAAAARYDALLRDKLAKEKMILGQRIREEDKVHDHLRQLDLMRAKQKVDSAKRAAAESRRATVSEAEKEAKDLEKIQSKEIADAKRAGRQKAQAELAAEREFSRSQRNQGGRDMPYRMGYWASRNFSPVTPMLSYAGRAAMGIARGAGIDLDIGNRVGNTIANQKLATDITNSGYISGAAGPNGQMQNAGDVLADVKKAANATALDYTQGLEGLQKFTAKTGDLETGRKILADMGKLARATGTAFEDMVDASGDVANALGDVSNKDQKIKSVMMAVAGMGKVGAVEIRDLAKQMAKIGAASGQFAGGAEANMITLTAMAQETRATGGAASATQAATSVASFMNTFSKAKRINAFQNITGRKLINEHNEIMGPEEIILESLRATKGDKMKMGQIVSDAGARRATRGFETIYNRAGGAKMVEFNAQTMPGLKGMAEKDSRGVYRVQAGLLAVVQEFERLKKATMTQADVDTAFARSMATDEAKLKQFGNKMQDVADKIAGVVLPQLAKLEPAVISVVESFASIAGWLAENPFNAIPLALGAAIAKAGIEQTIRVGIENVMRAAMGQGGGANAPGALGVAASAFVIASLAVTTLKVGQAYIDNWFTKKQEEQKKTVATELEAGNTAAVLQQQIKASEATGKGAVKQETLKQASERADELVKQSDALAANGPGLMEQMFRGFAVMTGQKSRKDIEKEDHDRMVKSTQMLEEAIALRRQIMNGTMKVEVTNMPDGGPKPKVDESGRTPDRAPED